MLVGEQVEDLDRSLARSSEVTRKGGASCAGESRDLITAERHVEGGGFVVRRPFPIARVDHIDPFLLIDEMGPIDYAPGQAVGAPDHPHRGFETVPTSSRAKVSTRIPPATAARCAPATSNG